MKILFIGRMKAAGLSHYKALKKINKKVDNIDLGKFFLKYKFFSIIFYHISPNIFVPFINYLILKKINQNYDLIYVTAADYVGGSLIKKLKKKTKKIIAFIEDNPFANRDKKRWKLYLESLKDYNLTIFFQKSRIEMGKKYGLKRTMLVWPPYDKENHFKRVISKTEKKELTCDVIFIGTWFPERGIFFKKLINLGLNLKIYGTRWNNDPSFENFKKHVILGHVRDPLYSKLIQSSKIAICLPSHGNFDEITKRSVEIPAIGGLLCAKKTNEHSKLFKENEEAIFFKNVNECYIKCKSLLNDYNKIKKIKSNGYKKISKIIKVDYYNMIKNILKEINKTN